MFPKKFRKLSTLSQNLLWKIFSSSSKYIFQKSFENLWKRSLPKIFLRSFKNLAPDACLPEVIDSMLQWCLCGDVDWTARVNVNLQNTHHRLNGSSSPMLTATSLSYGKAKNSTTTESKP